MRGLYAALSLAVAAAVWVGFAPYYLHRGTAPLPALTHAHAAVFTAWILLFAAQAWLMVARQPATHRRLGAVGAPLGAAKAHLGTALAIDSTHQHLARGGEAALRFLIIPLGDILVFVALAAAGLRSVRTTEAHARFMLLSTTSLLAPAIARWPLVAAGGPMAWFAITDLFVLAGPAYELVTRRRRRLSRAYAWGGTLVLVSQPLRLWVAHTDAWLRLAARLSG
jgi:hypothetical protein